ncbi:serine/threonine-protein kinase [Chondromyces crocatus]|uniref:Protein kinase domain-containing protein n=1 Tax=Chondromyces crocatus TaxID=52 RepID=A0A0K1EFD4_CHOCO|nr:serine/threonine-protein kinase [Chondromyces crocatus]AKT39298.1 uncharacterized protein CMC5_034450 [Chondromyces crocatus]
MSTPLAPDMIIGSKYRLIKPLGSGAMGTVWAAENGSTGRQVALKLLSNTEEHLQKRLLREARACGQLHHPNIVELFDVESTDAGDPFLVMELLEGQTLAQRLKGKRCIDPPLAARFARDIARGLAAAHAKQIIHRDLKPANIFLQRGETDVHLKILDFGVSKNLAVSDGLHTVAGAAIGSLAYMSPEQARAASDLDPRSDLWSVGILLVEMLTGERPIRGTAPQLVLQLVNGRIPPAAEVAPNVGPEFHAVIDRCLQRQRDARISSATELAALLEPLAQPASPAAISGQPPWPTAPRNAAPPASPAAISGQPPWPTAPRSAAPPASPMAWPAPSQAPQDDDSIEPETLHDALEEDDVTTSDDLLHEAATIQIQRRPSAPPAHHFPEGLGGTIRMARPSARPQAQAPEGAPRGFPPGSASHPASESLPAGPGGTELMLPLPTARPRLDAPPVPGPPHLGPSPASWSPPAFGGAGGVNKIHPSAPVSFPSDYLQTGEVAPPTSGPHPSLSFLLLLGVLSASLTVGLAILAYFLVR